MTEKLLPIGLAPEVPDTDISRQIELLSFGKILQVQILHFLCQLFILAIFFFGPPYISSRVQDFEFPCSNLNDSCPNVASSKRFIFECTNLQVFHSFLALDLVLFKATTSISVDPFNVTVSFASSQNVKGAHTGHPVSFPSRSFRVVFPKGSRESEHHRVFETSVVDYRDLHVWISVYYSDLHVVDRITGGEFYWFHGEPSHSVVHVFLRFVMFVLGLFVFVRLLVSNFNMESIHISVKLMFFLDSLLVLGSNPLYILTFFSSSNGLRLFDSLLGLFLLVAALFTAFALMIMTGLSHKDVSISWILVRFIPFAVVGLIFAAGLMSYHSLIKADPLAETLHVSKLFALAREIALVLYLIAYVIAAILTAPREIANERSAVIPLGIVFFVAISIIDGASARGQYAELKFANQIYSLLSIGTYILFFNFFNWPVNRANALRKAPKDSVGETFEFEEDV
jgi:hypothetical protein